MTSQETGKMTDGAVAALKTIIKSKTSTNSEKIQAAGKLAQIERGQSQNAHQKGIYRLTRAQIEAELHRCKAVLDATGL